LSYLKYLKAVNRNSKFPAKSREPGQVWAGTSAEIEWTWELQTEKVLGFAGKGPVSEAQGISRPDRDVPEKDGQ